MKQDTLHRWLCALGSLSALASARAADEPIGVKDRFEALHRTPGVAVAGWEIRPSLSLGAGFDDNVTQASGGEESSPTLSLRGSIDASFRSGVSTIVLAGSVGHTWYPSAAGNETTELNLRGAYSAELDPWTTVRVSSEYVTGTEDSRNNGLVVNGVFEPYTSRPSYERIPIEASWTFARGPLIVDGGVRAEHSAFEPLRTRSGTSITQTFRSGWEGEVRLRTSYELHPELALFAEGSATVRRFDDANADNEIWRALTGGRFELTRLLLGEVRAGFAEQSFPGGATASGFIYGARFRWYPDELLTIAAEAKRDFGAAVEQFGGVNLAVPTAQDTFSLRAEFEPLRTLMVFAQAAYEQSRREGVSGEEEDLWSLTAGAVYSLGTNLRLEAELDYRLGTSSFAGDFERTRINVGLVSSY